MVDDVVVSSQKIVKGAYSTAPATPTKDGYEFTGWRVGDLTVTPATYAITANTTFVAGFVVYHDVSFNLDGAIYVLKVLDNEPATTADGYSSISSPTKTGYDFVGWSLDGNSTIDIATYPVTASNLTFTALWTIQTFSVNFYSTKSTLLQSLTVDYGTPLADIVPSAPVRDYLIFKGWGDKKGTYYMSEESVSEALIKSNKSYYACYKHVYDGEFRKLDSSGDVALEICIYEGKVISSTFDVKNTAVTDPTYILCPGSAYNVDDVTYYYYFSYVADGDYFRYLCGLPGEEPVQDWGILERFYTADSCFVLD